MAETVAVLPEDVRHLADALRANTAELASFRLAITALAQALKPSAPLKPSNRDLLEHAVSQLQVVARSQDSLRSEVAEAIAKGGALPRMDRDT